MDGKVLILIAKEAIEAALAGMEFDFSKYKEYPYLNDLQATFVTLTLDGELRGCIGSLLATRPLIEDLVHNAKVAALNDPRFHPLTQAEFEKITIEISVLSAPKQLHYKDTQDLKQKIIPHTHGVILKQNFSQATFLPSVWQQLPTFEDFFAHLCQKAGLSQNCLDSHPQIFTYEALKFQ